MSMTKELVEKRTGERKWTTGLSYSWRKMRWHYKMELDGDEYLWLRWEQQVVVGKSLIHDFTAVTHSVKSDFVMFFCEVHEFP